MIDTMFASHTDKLALAEQHVLAEGILFSKSVMKPLWSQ